MTNQNKTVLGAAFVGVALLLAWRSPQETDVSKRLDRIEQKLTDFQQRLEKLELAAGGRPGRSNEAKIAASKAQMTSIRTALRMYEIDLGRLPTTEQGLRALVDKPEPAPKNWKKYLESDSALKDVWGNAFVYRCPGEKNKGDYDLFSMGPDGKAGTADDISIGD